MPEDDAVESLTPLWQGQIFSNGKFGTIRHPLYRSSGFAAGFALKSFKVIRCAKIIRSIFAATVLERKVEGTFVDERSQNKLLRLKQALGNKG